MLMILRLRVVKKALRDFTDFILHKQNIFEDIILKHINKEIMYE